MIQQLSNNPFRMLGVCSNAPAREIVANKNRMNVFLKVGKETSFPLDLVAYLGELQRMPENITAADSQLTIEKDRLLAAQFWFVRMTPTDDEAFALLAAGNYDGAIDLWQKMDNASSMQNRAMCCLMTGDLQSACCCISVLYERYLDDFVAAIGIRNNVTLDEMVYGFVAELQRSKPDIERYILLDPRYQDSWNVAARATMVDLLVKRLEEAVKISKSAVDIEVRIAACKRLLDESRRVFEKLKELIRKKDQRFVNLSDMVATELMDCATECITKKMDIDILAKAARLMNEAQDIPAGKDVKEKYFNVYSACKFAVELEHPEIVEQEFQAVKDAINKYNDRENGLDSALELMFFAQDQIANIRQKMGDDKSFDKNLSSFVVMSIHNKSIADINKAVTDFNLAKEGSSKRRKSGEVCLRMIDRALVIFERLEKYEMNAETHDKLMSDTRQLKDAREQYLHIQEEGYGCIYKFFTILAKVIQTYYRVIIVLWLISFIARKCGG